MRFYTKEHRYHCGIDPPTRLVYVCILDRRGDVRPRKNMPAGPQPFLQAIEPVREDVVVRRRVSSCLVQARRLVRPRTDPLRSWPRLLYRTVAIQGGKAKNDKLDCPKTARPFRAA